ncbi:hypothetical protein PQE71_gp034 [Bacillus phage Izhevsk]|uniref:Uncharacterized protein n=1 Tax=Bacillus phage Izhevsk TaxID=2724322 RepID=A0A6H0X5Z8_9CAUD|nr:hypothetical protein PQE71_gp034 [Bacillus phage Izhevsk]QIW89716.1 hypothetical protein Izhevsk_34 [Bacillus phage Izhevsk]
MISVWVDVENYNKYKNGEDAIAWSTQGKNQKINLLVPLTNVKCVEDLGREGIEIDIFNGG